MPFRYAAHHVGKCPELIDRIMRNYNPVSKFHHDPDHQKERKDQMRRGQCSDADALTRMARVCSLWFYCAVPLLWHDISGKDLEVYLTTGHSLERGNFEAFQELLRLSTGAGRYIRTLYVQANREDQLKYFIPQDRFRLGFDTVKDLHLELSHPHSLVCAREFLDTTALSVLSITVRSFDEDPQGWALLLQEWFTAAFDHIARSPSTFRLIVEDPCLWAFIAHVVVPRLCNMHVLKKLEFHVNMLTADIVEMLQPLAREGVLEAICAVGECTRPNLNPDNYDMDVDMNESDDDESAYSLQPYTNCSWTRQLSLCGTLAQAQELLTRLYNPDCLRHLDLSLVNLPTPTSLHEFLRFIAGSCSRIQVLRISFPKATLDFPHTLNWVDLEVLIACEDLEELVLVNSPGIELRSSDVLRIEDAWPKLRVLKLVPHASRYQPDIMPSFGSLYYLAERCPSLTELVLPFSVEQAAKDLLAAAMRRDGLTADVVDPPLNTGWSPTLVDAFRDDGVTVPALMHMPREFDAELRTLVDIFPSSFSRASVQVGSEICIWRTSGATVTFTRPVWYRDPIPVLYADTDFVDEVMSYCPSPISL